MGQKNTSRNLFLEAMLLAVDFVLTGFVTRYIWNNILATMFGFRLITYWQGVGNDIYSLLVLSAEHEGKGKQRSKVVNRRYLLHDIVLGRNDLICRTWIFLRRIKTMANTQVANQMKLGITQAGVDYVTGQLEEKEKAGLCFPVNYSIRNAMQSAFLMLREAETKDGRPLLEVCTQESVVQSLMQMATQGLNPVKKQCYFVAYGSKCKLAPSYFGTLAILNRVKNLQRQPVANVVRQGDIFEYGYDLDTMELTIHKHETRIENLDNPVVAAYAIIVTDKEKVVEIMSRKQLEQAWAQGQSWKSAKNKGYDSATHKNFPEEMAKKSVLNRAAKRLINATDDSSVMSEEAIQAFNEVENNDNLDIVAEQVAEDIAQNANSVLFDETPIIEQKQPSKTVNDVTAGGKIKEPVYVENASTKADVIDVDDDGPDFLND